MKFVDNFCVAFSNCDSECYLIFVTSLGDVVDK